MKLHHSCAQCTLPRPFCWTPGNPSGMDLQHPEPGHRESVSCRSQDASPRWPWGTVARRAAALALLPWCCCRHKMGMLLTAAIAGAAPAWMPFLLLLLVPPSGAGAALPCCLLGDTRRVSLLQFHDLIPHAFPDIRAFSADLSVPVPPHTEHFLPSFHPLHDALSHTRAGQVCTTH